MIAPLLAAAAGATRAVRLGGGEPVDVPILRILAALSLCLLVATLAILLIRQRRGRVGAGRWLSGLAPSAAMVEVVEVRRLGAHADVGLIRHADREYLLLLQSGGALVLDGGQAAVPARAGE